jgi:Zn-dependent protease with chaperone function
MNQWEGSLRPVVLLGLGFVAALAAAYVWLLPVAVAAAAERVPASVAEAVSNETLRALDASTLQPSTVPAARQARLVDRFGSLRFPDGSSVQAYRIVFRSSDDLGPNAMALPSGTLVVTDALVNLSDDDNELMAVLAHETGHVERQHGMRQLFQNSTIALAMTWLLGDVSMLAAAAPAALLQARYSRELEREADRHALEVLDANGIPREHFARILRRLQDHASAQGASEGGVLGYLSSHPVTDERVAEIR